VTILIEPRFCGPDESGNGGYTAGLFALRVGADVGTGGAVVTLRQPPPLAKPLSVVADDAGLFQVLDGASLVADVARTSLDVDAVAPVPADAARAAEASYAGFSAHPFPHCFVCGPARNDGLRLAPGPVGPGATACTWVPDESLPTVDGAAAPQVVWAALDCPGGWTGDIVGRPMVLGRMAAAIESLPEVGEPCVVVGRRLGVEGRKMWTATTAYGADGRELGRAHATWIAVASAPR
jgi:hypothetical protein